MKTYYAIRYGVMDITNLGEFDNEQDATAYASEQGFGFDDYCLSEAQLFKLGSSIDSIMGVHEDVAVTEEDGLPVMARPYTDIVTVQFAANKGVAKKLVSFFYSHEWKMMLAKALGTLGIVHFSTDANNVKLTSRGMMLEEKLLCKSTFGEDACIVQDARFSGKQTTLEVGTSGRKAPPAKKKVADAVTVAPKKS